jgi:hypothetical protein
MRSKPSAAVSPNDVLYQEYPLYFTIAPRRFLMLAWNALVIHYGEPPSH